MSEIIWGKYRKLPLEVHAVQLIEARAGQPRRLGPTSIPDWFAIAQMRGDIVNATDPEGNEIDGLIIKTLEGNMRAMPGDWIIRGVEGEIYPCKPDIFDRSYEQVTSP